MTPPTADSVPRLGQGFRLQWEPAQECHVILYPEGMVKLNQSGGEILQRCDGRRSLADIVRELEAAFGATGLEREVLGFVEVAGRQRWLEWT
ncbi:MAG: pyrroloquinoline quinone biosynthesis peptide chaperone PqqD [Variovorax sp.]